METVMKHRKRTRSKWKAIKFSECWRLFFLSCCSLMRLTYSCVGTNGLNWAERRFVPSDVHRGIKEWSAPRLLCMFHTVFSTTFTHTVQGPEKETAPDILFNTVCTQGLLYPPQPTQTQPEHTQTLYSSRICGMSQGVKLILTPAKWLPSEQNHVIAGLK